MAELFWVILALFSSCPGQAEQRAVKPSSLLPQLLATFQTARVKSHYSLRHGLPLVCAIQAASPRLGAVLLYISCVSIRVCLLDYSSLVTLNSVVNQITPGLSPQLLGYPSVCVIYDPDSLIAPPSHSSNSA